MAGKKPALGRGLESLFGDLETKVPVKKSAETAGQAENAVLYIGIDDIKPNSSQPRQAFDPVTIDELAASIEAYGIIHPVMLQKGESGYELVSGERRWRAARKAGLKTVPAIVRDVTEEESALFAIIENVQREDLNTIEEAAAYQALIKKYGLTQEGVAKMVGKSRPHIANTLRVLSMQEEIVIMLRNGDLTLGHANALGAVKDQGKQLKLARTVVLNGLSVRATERLALLAESKGEKKAVKKEKAEGIHEVEQELTSATGVRVKIKGNGEKGSVELLYYDREGLEEIIDLLRKAGG